MPDPRNISINDFTYSLPEDKIASYPLTERDASKLLVYKNGNISEDIYRNIADHIPENSLLVFNNTRVVAARLLFQKDSGAQIEIFCLEPHEQYPDITTAMLQKESVQWLCLVGGVSKWKHGQVLEKTIRQNNKELILQAAYIEKRADTFVIKLSWNHHNISFAEILSFAGATPLPPYIKRLPDAADLERYQTIYAKSDGSVAAPTAGLHFTGAVFRKLKEKNIQTDFVTLHVGAGTFKPVKAATMQEHEMHAEFIDVSKTFIENLLRHLNKPIIAVGTTSLRTMESLYWLGRKPELRSGPDLPQRSSGIQQLPGVSQWEAYEEPEKSIPVNEALESLLAWMNSNKMERLVTKTQLLIAPGYDFKIVKGLITNFHQPQSTLLLLVAALIGNETNQYEEWKKVYDYALQNDFRFLSYGDGSLLWLTKP